MTYYHYATNDVPRRLVSAPLRDALEMGQTLPGVAKVVAVVDLALPSGAVTWGPAGGRSKTLGDFEPRIASWSEMRRQVSRLSYELANVNFSMDVTDDASRSLAMAYSKYPRTFANFAATVRILCEGIPPAACPRIPLIVDSVEPLGELMWRFKLQFDQRPLELKIPRKQISLGDWPGASPAVVGQRAQIVLGQQDSSSVTNKGFVPTQVLDVGAFVYGVTLGVTQVPVVYKDGVVVSSGYTVSWPIVNSYQWTIITFSATQGTSKITCDVAGLTDNGAGGGNVLRTKPEILQWLLVNQVFGEWRSGPYLDPAAAPISTYYFGELAAEQAQQSHEGSQTLGGSQEPTTGKALLASFGKSNEARAFWTLDGRIAVRSLRLRAPNVYDAEWAEFLSRHVLGDRVDFNLESSDLARKLTASYLPSTADGKFMASLNVFEPSVEEDITDKLDLPWSSAR